MLQKSSSIYTVSCQLLYWQKSHKICFTTIFLKHTLLTHPHENSHLKQPLMVNYWAMYLIYKRWKWWNFKILQPNKIHQMTDSILTLSTWLVQIVLTSHPFICLPVAIIRISGKIQRVESANASSSVYKIRGKLFL